MTNKEALKKIKVARIANSTWGFYDDNVFVIVIKALEKQIPKKPIEDGYHDMPCVCPECGFNVGEPNYSEYCQLCGQAIDWSEK